MEFHLFHVKGNAPRNSAPADYDGGSVMGPEGPRSGSSRLTDKPENLNELIDAYIARFSAPSKHVSLVHYSHRRENGGLVCEQRVQIFTDRNKYIICARWGDNEKGYLGCISKSRKPRAGEDWHRGSDLIDGPFTYGTWFNILGDIVSYEMVPLAKQARPIAETADSFQHQLPPGELSMAGATAAGVPAGHGLGSPQSPAADRSD